MVMPTNHVIPGPDLHCPGAQALWGFSQHLPAKYKQRPKKKSYYVRAKPLGLCHIVRVRLDWTQSNAKRRKATKI